MPPSIPPSRRATRTSAGWDFLSRAGDCHQHALPVVGPHFARQKFGWRYDADRHLDAIDYLILDLYSRKIVGWEVHGEDDADHAADLVRRTAFAEGIATSATKPVLHGDNGATLKATTVLAMLHWLGVKPSYSRPRVSDDNAFAEALFRTAKYRPEFPADGFTDLDAARAWAMRFTHWYNFEHQHSGIKYVSPAQRHAGDDHVILDARHAVYLAARQRNPARWSGATRNWTPIGPVTLNPERDSVVDLAATVEGISQKAA
jgi:putative transposase